MKLFLEEQQTWGLKQEMMTYRGPGPLMEGCRLQLQGWVVGNVILIDG